MRVFSSFFAEATPRYSVLYDIGSGSVGAALIEYTDTHVRVVSALREPLPFSDEQHADEFAGLIAHTLARVSESVREELGRRSLKPHEYDIRTIVHTPWAYTHSTSVSGHFERETVVTRNVLRSFVAERLSTSAPEGHTQFNRHITRIELNGYHTNNPYKKSATHLSVSILVSSMPSAIYNVINEAFANLFPGHTIRIDSFIYTSMQLPELADTADSYTFVDIGGERAVVYVVRDHTILAHAQIPFGVQHVLRGVTHNDPEKTPAAASLLTMYLANTCTPSQCRKVEEALEPVEAEWTRAFGEAAARITKTHRLPTPTYVSVDAQSAAWFIRTLKKIDFCQFTVTTEPLAPRILSFESEVSALLLVESVPKDTPLLLAARSLAALRDRV